MSILEDYREIKNKIDQQSQSYELKTLGELKEVDNVLKKYNFNLIQLQFLNNPFYIEKLKNLEKLRDLMERVSKTREDYPFLMEDIMRFWAKVTGTGEDELIADELLYDLLNNGYITEKDFEIYETAKPVNRWR